MLILLIEYIEAYTRTCLQRKGKLRIMQWSQWFAKQLSSSMDILVWAIQQVPTKHLAIVPLHARLGTWSVYRHIFHMLYYEETVALSGIEYWQGQASPFPTSDDLEEASWEGYTDLENMLAQLQEIRKQQVAVILALNEELWNEILPTQWGNQTLSWFVCKTYQHTLEHTNNILRIALFWDYLPLPGIQEAKK